LSLVDQRFPKSCRLLDSKAYEQVFSKPDFRVSNKYFLVLGCWTTLDTARLGIIVGTKHIARANQRNRVKRLVRETFRTNRANMPCADLVVLARHKELQDLENNACHSLLHALMEEITKKRQ